MATSRARRPEPVTATARRWIMGIAGIVGALGITFAGFIAVDSRYALAADLRSISRQIEIGSVQSEITVLELRKSALQDKVFEARARSKGRESQSQTAINERTEDSLSDVKREIARRKELLDKLKAGARQ